ncbi:MAG: 50S ribosomal protein L10 [Treponema sp.]
MALRTKNPKTLKSDMISAIETKAKASSSLIFTEYRGMTVAQISDLRKKLKESNSTYKVVRNNFARIAFANANIAEGIDSYLVGPTAVVYVEGDETNAAAKVLFDFMEEVPALVVKGAVVEGELYDAAKIEAFSKLPGKKQLISMFMSTLNATTSKFVRTLQAIVDSKGSEEASS